MIQSNKLDIVTYLTDSIDRKLSNDIIEERDSPNVIRLLYEELIYTQQKGYK